MGYVLAVRANHALTVSSGRTVAAAGAIRLILRGAWQRMRMLRGAVIQPPRRDHAHRQHWSQWRRRHQYRGGQAHRRWNS
jgi:hypothetical protein